MSIGKRLREFANWKFGQIKLLANRLEIAPSNFQMILNDKRELTSSMLIKLKNDGCDLEWLLSGKRNLWQIDLKMWRRINKKIKDLVSLYSITDEELNSRSLKEEFAERLNSKNEETITEKIYAKVICYNWKENNSISVSLLIKLAELTKTELYWLLTGEQKSVELIKDVFIFKYPELALLLELRKNPELFSKIKLYVDSVTSSTSTGELEKISKEIDSISKDKS